MKYCPQCKRQFDEPWLSFCSDDGTPLVQDPTPLDPIWDPGINEPPKRETKVETPPSEQQTEWLPREPPMPRAWVAPDERPPMNSPVWQPPPAPPYRPTNARPTQGLALASMITAIAGILLGSCFGPLPAIAALIMGIMALVQIKNSPDKATGKPYAVAGVIISALNLVFYVLLLIWFLVAVGSS
jgi:uncharacterized protein DUF4190